ncbi:beta strand repeat-containing protein [Paramylibacter ulvae]|uniref:beta strand repeat-containing protein n=1 Tax=Paramylibacter ulvae TaxID=1651968 RepID=UPI001E4952AB|nr:DUF11 domain-containing protein [Amylibacter ulvae]
MAIFATNQVRAQTPVTLDQPSLITDGVRLCDITGLYCLDITTNPASDETVRYTTAPRIGDINSVQNDELIILDYDTANSPTPFSFDAVSIADINSLTPGGGPTAVRDAYSWGAPGTWTLTGSPVGAVVSIDRSAPDDVGNFISTDPNGNNNIGNVGQFTLLPADAGDVLLNMRGSSNGHNATYAFAGPLSSVQLYVFNSGGGNMRWNYVPSMTVDTYAPQMTLVKSTASTPTVAGETLTYNFVVENIGDTVITSLLLSDSKCAAPPVQLTGDAILLLNDTHTFTCESIPVTQEEVDAGQVDNTASLIGTPTGGLLPPVEDTVSVPIVADPQAVLTKEVDIGLVSATGLLTYTITVENTGNVSLTSPSLTDVVTQSANTLSLTSGPTLVSGDDGDGEIDPNETWEYTATYNVTAANIDDGGDIVNTVDFDSDQLPTQSDDATTEIQATPSATITKDVDSASIDATGTLTYTIVVENTGDVTLTSPTLTDTVSQSAGTFALSSGPTLVTGDDGNGDIDPNETWEYTATYVVTQDNIDDGGDIVNAVDFDSDQLPTLSDDATTTIDQTPNAVVTKDVDSASIDAEGTLTYTITVENTGNVTLTTPVLSDTLTQSTTTYALATGPTLVSGDDGSGDIDVDETWEYTATYVVTQDNIDDGGDIVNAVDFDSDQLPTLSDDATTTIDQTPNAVVTKDVDSASIDAEGALTYTITVENTGNVTLTTPVLSDTLTQSATTYALASGPTLVSGDDGNGDIDVDETWEYTATYVVTQDNIDDGGNISNLASFDSDQLPTISDAATTTITQNADATIDKVVDIASISAPGTLTYTITIENTGNVALIDPAIGDDLVQDGNALTLTSGPTLTSGDDGDGEIGVAETWEYSVTYAVTQDDIDNGADIVNTATFNSRDTADISDDATTTISQSPDLTIDKVVDIAATADQEALTYTITVENTGNTSLTNPILADDLTQGGNGLTLSSGPVLSGGDTNNDGVIDVGETWEYTATFNLTLAEFDAASDVVNTATITTDQTPAASADATTTLTAEPSISLDKRFIEVTGGASSFTAVGDELNYEFEITNTGNVTLAGPFSVADTITSGAGGAISVVCPAGDVAPDASVICTGSYLATQDDLDAGLVDNSATASEPTVTTDADDTDTESVPAIQNPSLAFEKTAREIAPEDFVVGATVTYDYLVTNDGNQTIFDPIIVTDNRIDPADMNCEPFPATGIAPTQTYTCTADYIVTSDDAIIGSVTNIASASDGTTNSPSDSATVPSGAEPALTTEKSSPDTTFAQEGDVLNYEFTVTNSGNATFGREIEIVDDKIGTITCWTPTASDPDLRPESSDGTIPAEFVTCTAPYTVTQDDLDAGFVTNEAYSQTIFGDPTNPTDVVSPVVDLTIDADADPSLDLVKSAALPAGKATADLVVGDLITYTFSVENTGNQTITNVTVTDPLIAGFSCTIATLPVETTDTSCSDTYAITQDDIDDGVINNTADAAGSDPTGATIDDTDTIATDMPDANPSMELIKTASPSPFGAVGSTITYSFSVENTGNVTLTDVIVTDPLIPTFNCVIPTLAVGATDTVTCSTPYTVTQDDVDAGELTNTADVDATDPFNTPVNATDSITTDGPDQTPTWTVDKATTSVPTAEGDTLDYTFDVENTGNVSISAISLTDAKCATGPNLVSSSDIDGDGVLSPDEIWNYTCTSIPVTQAEVDAGQVDNSATATGTPAGGTLNDATGTNSTDVVADPSWTVDKSSLSTPMAAGDTLEYSFDVENTGNVSISAIALTDVKCAVAPALTNGTDTNSDGVLSPDEIWTFTCTSIPVTQAEADAGVVENNVSAAGTPAGGTLPDAMGSDATALLSNPSLEVQKTITSSTVAVGETVTFEITVENTGNVTLTGTGLADTLTRADGTVLALTSGPSFVSADDGSGPGAIQVGETATYAATYILTQDDIDAGGIANTATATGNPPQGSPVSDVSDDGDGPGTDDPTVLTIPALPSISLDKRFVDVTGGASSFSAVGDELNYEFEITNTGNVTLAGPFSVADTITSGAGGAISVFCPAGDVAPDASVICTGSYLATQDDLDAGLVDNSATASEPTVTTDADDTDTESVPAIQNPSLAFEKTAREIAPEDFVVGATVTYDYLVTNDGNVTITAPITISDNLIDPSGITCDAFPAEGVAPTETYACVGVYTVTSDDVELGSATNVAGASDGTTDSPSDSATVPSGAAPALTTEKISPDTTFATAGDILNYEFTVTNTGNAAFVNDIVIVDDKIGTITCWTPTGDDPDFRAESSDGTIPADTITCTAPYTVTQDDLDAGFVTNEAYSQTTYGDPDNPTDVVSPVVDLTIDADADPSLDLVKSAALPAGKATADLVVGDLITYTFSVENTGNQTITNVSVTDPLIAGFSCTIATLPVETTDTSCSDTYAITQDDIDAGVINNTADAAGSDPTGATIDDTDTIATDMPDANPSMELIKTANPSPFGAVGSTITYSFSVENTGNVTLTDVTVTDPLIPTFSCVIPTLAVGATDTVTCSTPYTVTQDDVDAGELTNTADVDATDPFDTPVNATDSITTDGPEQEPALEVTKTLSSTGASEGDVLTYSITVENTGNVTLNNVVMSDVMTRSDESTTALDAPGLQFVSGDGDTPDAIDVGETWTFSANYTLTQDDLNAGGISNKATATADDPNGTPVSDESDNGDDSDGDTTGDPTVFVIPAGPAINIEKTVTNVTGGAAGDIVTFGFTVNNVGNVDLDTITLVDTLTNSDGDALTLTTGPVLDSGDVGNAGVLDVTETWVYSATYELTQDDIDAGGISNTATASGTDPNGTTVSDVSDNGDDGDGNPNDDPTLLVIDAVPSMELDKVATSVGGAAGELVEFEFTLVNTGNVTLSNIVLIDNLTRADGTLLALDAAPTFVSATQGSANGTLNVGETATYTAQYTLQLADIDAGGIANSATAQGEAPNGVSVSDVSDDDDDTDGNTTDDATVVPLERAPALELSKAAALDDGGDGFYQVGDTITYTYVVVNTGNATVFDVSILENPANFSGTGTLPVAVYVSGGDDLDGEADLTDLEPEQSATFSAVYDLTQADIDSASVSNKADASGTDAAGENVSDSSDDPNQPGDDDPTLAAIPVQDPDAVVATKSATPGDVKIGDTVTYTLTFAGGANGGSVSDGQARDVLPTGIIYRPDTATLNGTATEPDQAGQSLTWSGLYLAPNQTIMIVYQGVVSPNAPLGEMTNRAWFADADGNVLSNVARATVKRTPEHVFDCSDVIGKVFDDRNGNGYQDGPSGGVTNQDYDPSGKYGNLPATNQGEPGLAGVRIVTVGGVLITTDEFGRYHVPCAALPDKHGSNFILKLDERSLPSGYRMTTENPRVMRLTPGKFAKMNFGASISNVIRIDLNGTAFEGGMTPKPKFKLAVRNLVKQMQSKPSVLRLTYVYNDGAGKALARKRLAAVEKMIRAEWRKQGRYKLNIERTIKRLK